MKRAPQNDKSRLNHPLSYLARYRGQVLAGIAFLVLTNICAQAVPWVVKRAIETMEENAAGGSERLNLLVLLLVGLTLAQTGVRVLSRIMIFNAGRDAEYSIRNMIFGHLCKLDGGFYRRFTTGDLMSRLTNDLASVRALYGAGVLHIVNTICAYAVALPLMLGIDPALTFWALFPYPVLMLGARAFARGIYGRSRDQQLALAGMTESVQEDLAGIREVKSYRLEERRSQRFTERSFSYLDSAVRLARWRSGMLPFVGMGVGSSIVLILWLGGSKVVAGELSLGDLVAMNLYVGLLAWPTMSIGWMLSLWQRGIAAWHRIGDILAAEPALTDDEALIGEPDLEGNIKDASLRVRNLSVSIDGKPILQDLSFDVAEGSLCAIVGRVGAGKTTLAEALARLLPIPAESVQMGGVDITRLPLAQVRGRIAYAPQDPFLFSTTIEENIAMGLSEEATLPKAERTARIENACRAAGLHGDLKGLPHGLQTVVGERGITLSGGQRQRTALARALISDRSLLLLDDSLSAVDAETERTILSGLKEVIRGRTAILISHRLSALQHADQVVVLENGAVAEVGSHEQLLAADGIYSDLYRRQLLLEQVQ